LLKIPVSLNYENMVDEACAAINPTFFLFIAAQAGINISDGTVI